MVKIYLNRDIKADTLLVGFKGIGQVGYLTLKYLIDKLKPIERVGIIDSLYIPPIITVEKNGLSYPLELYEYNNKFLILRSEDIPTGKAGSYLIRNIVKLFKELGIKRIIAIGGLVSSLKENEEDTFRVSYNTYWKENLGYRVTQTDVKIFGPLAHILFYCEIFKLPALALLAYADPNQLIDFRGVYNAVKAISKMFNLNIDLEDLIETINQVEEKIRKIEEATLMKERGKFMYT